MRKSDPYKRNWVKHKNWLKSKIVELRKQVRSDKKLKQNVVMLRVEVLDIVESIMQNMVENENAA